MSKKTILDVNFQNKKTLVRVDFNVPIIDGKITDDNRIVEALPTINYLLEKGAKVILFSHLGRIKSEEDKAKNSLKVVAIRLEELLKKPVTFVPEIQGKKLEDAINNLKSGEVLLFENTRFADLDNKKESKNDPELGKYWASLGEVFVNDAFGVAHRAQASNVGIATHLPTVAGFLMEKEIKYLGEAVENPKRPFVAILGGAKVSDKISVIENLLKVADKVLIGGAMAYTFRKAEGGEVGLSRVENDKLDLARKLLEKGKGKLVISVDCTTGQSFDNETPRNTRKNNAIPANEEGLDVGPETIKLFSEEIAKAKTIVWNGPLGVFEMPNFAVGTKSVAAAISENKNATSIIGGGDSAAAVIQMGLRDGFTHISTGGGASLEYLEGKVLPGISCINDK